MHMTTNSPLANNHISVDCVVSGFEGEQLKVLLLNRPEWGKAMVHIVVKLDSSLFIR